MFWTNILLVLILISIWVGNANITHHATMQKEALKDRWFDEDNIRRGWKS